MAILSGRCANCGSIIRLDDKNEFAVCIFCHAKTDVATALDIEANPKNYTFPNEPQGELTDEEAKLALVGQRHNDASALRKAKLAADAASARSAKEAKPSAAERVNALKSKPVEVSKVTVKQALAIVAGILLFIGIIAAVSVPAMLERNRNRAELSARIGDICPVKLKSADHYAFNGQKNQSLTIVLPEAADEAAAKQMYEALKRERAVVYALPETDEQSNVKLTLISTTGAIEVSNDQVTMSEK
jgi:hypothetical protein